VDPKQRCLFCLKENALSLHIYKCKVQTTLQKVYVQNVLGCTEGPWKYCSKRGERRGERRGPTCNVGCYCCTEQINCFVQSKNLVRLSGLQETVSHENHQSKLRNQKWYRHSRPITSYLLKKVFEFLRIKRDTASGIWGKSGFFRVFQSIIG